MSQSGDGGTQGDDWGPDEPTPWDQPRDDVPPPGGFETRGRPRPAPPGQQLAPPPNYLVHSILATLLCCLPTGIVGIVYAGQVNGKLAAGDLLGAQAASQKARLWTIISVVAGLTVGSIYLLVYNASL